MNNKLNTIKARGYEITSEDIFAGFAEPYSDHVLAYKLHKYACPDCGQVANVDKNLVPYKDRCRCSCGTKWELDK